MVIQLLMLMLCGMGFTLWQHTGTVNHIRIFLRLHPGPHNSGHVETKVHTVPFPVSPRVPSNLDLTSSVITCSQFFPWPRCGSLGSKCFTAEGAFSNNQQPVGSATSRLF